MVEYKAKVNVLQYKPGDVIPTDIVEMNPNLKEFVTWKEVKEKPVPKKDVFDLNNDGKVDKKDVKIALKRVFGKRKKK